jgi:hypothetical protein
MKNKLFNNRILFGGEEIDYMTNKSFLSYKKIEAFISIIIIGYFGIKIVYGLFFNFYPQKFYYRNIDISTNENVDSGNTSNITLNAYVPGLWNNEMTDFITLIVLTAIIFVYTNVSTKSFIDTNGNLSLSFLIGYIIGLGYPPIYVNYFQLFNDNEAKNSDVFKYVYLIFFCIFIIFIIALNYTSADKLSSKHKFNYLIYISAIALLFFGLMFAKKNIKSYNSVTYFYNNGEQCTFAKNGVFQSSGEKINITISFLSFIILLFFSYEPEELGMKNLYVFIYALLLGILVSSISYFGIEYFLLKQPEKECKDLNECVLKEMPEPIPEKKVDRPNNNKIDDIQINPNIKKAIYPKISTLKMIIILILILISIFLIYYYLIK